MHRTWLMLVGFVALVLATFVQVYRASQSETTSARDADVVGKLAGTNADSRFPGLIPPGMRAVSVRVNDVTATAGFVAPGTRVDVLLTHTLNEQHTIAVLQNVVVLAAGTRLEHSSAGEPQQAPVVTLLVSPEDAKKLTPASSEGHIQCVLRNPLDLKQPRQRERKPKRSKPVPPPPISPWFPKPIPPERPLKPTTQQTGVTRPLQKPCNQFAIT